MGYDYPECFVSYNNCGVNDSLNEDGNDDVTICWECLFDEILNDCELRGRSRYYAQQNIVKYDKCWMCKKMKKLLYQNIPIDKCYREEYGISEPEEFNTDSKKKFKYCCLKCFEKDNLILVDENDYVETQKNDCEFCNRTKVVCLCVYNSR